jgi:hypothetical protein
MKITIDAETARQYKLYATVRHAEVGAVIAYALRDWMESIGEGRIEDALGVENEVTRAINRMSFESDPDEEESEESAPAACNRSRMN